ncbi:MAG: chloride channel protein [Marinagarivorans sp.]|nr:chloride channel protein [Marinagarivorans sp.]
MPKTFARLAKCLDNLVVQFRHSLSYTDSLPQLTLLGLVVGLFTGLIIVLFRLCIELPMEQFMPAGAESFEQLEPIVRVILIFVGTFFLWLFLHFMGPEAAQVSVGHVLHRLHNFQGRLPRRNWFAQFLGGIICLLSGFSVGREGPAIHLGAGCASQVGNWLRLPNNSRHTLVGCGVAAAIAASFDTPMAGVIFAMEVIVMEYTIVGFVPVIMASVTGAALSQAIFSGVADVIPVRSDMDSLKELPFMVLTGVVIALSAALFIRLNITAMQLRHWPLWLRLLIAATITSSVAWWLPEVMGLGYDTLHGVMAGELLLGALLLIGFAKILVSAFTIGLGLPGGVIGPALVSGACLGGALGLLVHTIYPEIVAAPAFYVLIGMTGMMAAVINAPLAALVAVLELSYNPHIIFPAMLVIVVASVTTRYFFNFAGIFTEQLKHTGRPLTLKPAQQALRRAGVRSVMETAIVITYPVIDYDTAKKLLAQKPHWLILDQAPRYVALKAANLASWLDDAPVSVLTLEEDIDLFAIPAQRLILLPIYEDATLWEAEQVLAQGQSDALYVTTSNGSIVQSIQGVVTAEHLDNFYHS